jgi:hypothetical protein
VNIRQRLLDEHESDRLEFKAAEVLKNPSRVARAVVAMLNASTGGYVSEIWIGVGERDSVAVDLHGVSDPERERGRLRDTLVDTIEPRPTSEEVSVDVVDAGQGCRLLRVSVRCKRARKPFALNKDGRHYLQRVQDRIVPLTYDELRELWRPSTSDRGDEDAASRWLVDSVHNITKQAKTPTLWFAAAPARAMSIDLSASSTLDWLRDPSVTGVRPHGWTFFRRGAAPRLSQDRLEVGAEDTGLLRLWRQGRLEMRVPLAMLEHTRIRREPIAREIYPLALVEYPTSLMRLASKVFEQGDTTVHVALALVGARGAKLGAYSPNSIEWQFGDRLETFDDGDDLILAPLEFTREEVVSAPDACAYRLLVKVYEAFHMGPDKLPREFDRLTQRLVLE